MKRIRELDGKVMKTFVWVGLVLQQVLIWFSLVGPFQKQVIRMTLPRVGCFYIRHHVTVKSDIITLYGSWWCAVYRFPIS